MFMVEVGGWKGGWVVNYFGQIFAFIEQVNNIYQ